MRRALLDRLERKRDRLPSHVRVVDWATGEARLLPVMPNGVVKIPSGKWAPPLEWSASPNHYTGIGAALNAAVAHAEMRPDVARCFAQTVLGGES